MELDARAQLETLRAAIDDATRHRIDALIDPDLWHGLGDPPIDASVEAILIVQNARWIEAEQQGQRHRRHLGALAMERRADLPIVPWLAAEVLVAIPLKTRKFFVNDLLATFARDFGDRLAAPLAWHLANGDTGPRKLLFAWLGQHAPAAGGAAWLKAIEEGGATQALAVSHLPSVTPTPTAELVALLSSRKAAVRAAAATVLGRCPSAEGLAGLQARLAKEKNAKARAALEGAVGACELEVGDGPATAELDARLAARAPDALPDVIDVAALPPIRWADGEPLSEGALRWVLGGLARESAKRADTELRRVCARLEPSDTSALYAALQAQLRAARIALDTEWTLFMRAVIGDDAQMVALGEQAARWSARIAAKAVEVLRRNPTPGAIRALDHLSRVASGRKTREAASQAVERIADSVPGGREALLDQSIPFIGAANEAALRDRLEAMMFVDRRWPLAAWRGFVVDHPLAANSRPGLVFQVVDGPCFRWQDGAIGVDGQPIELPDDALVRLPHPSALDPATRQAWITHLDAAGLAAPFPQLEIPLHAVRDPSAPFERFRQSTARALAIAEVLSDHGFDADPAEDGGNIFGATRAWLDGWSTQISHGGYSARPGLMGKTERSPLYTPSIKRGDDWITAAEVPAGLVQVLIGAMKALEAT